MVQRIQSKHGKVTIFKVKYYSFHKLKQKNDFDENT